MEIRVVLPDAFAASDLTWFLNASAQVSHLEGQHVVDVSAGQSVRHVLAQIHDWATLNQISPVVVHVTGDEKLPGLDSNQQHFG